MAPGAWPALELRRHQPREAGSRLLTYSRLSVYLTIPAALKAGDVSRPITHINMRVADKRNIASRRQPSAPRIGSIDMLRRENNASSIIISRHHIGEKGLYIRWRSAARLEIVAANSRRQVVDEAAISYQQPNRATNIIGDA